MKKTIFALAAVAALAVGSLGNPTPAEARCHGCGIGLGILGGVAAGAIIGSAIAGSQPRYVEPEPVYVEPPPPPGAYYVEPADVGPVCHTVRRRVFIDGVGYRWTREDVCD